MNGKDRALAALREEKETLEAQQLASEPYLFDII
jgi:hypothetical protein